MKKAHKSIEEWDADAALAKKQFPLKVLQNRPKMVGIACKRLKWKALKWMILEDHSRIITKNILKKPLKHCFAYLKSLLKKQAFTREGDFFFYGIPHLDAFKELLASPNTHLLLGFSYCHKPFECPSGRFSTSCMHDKDNPVCRQCFIGKVLHFLPEKNLTPLFITTVHYIGEQVFHAIKTYPDKQIIFLITACEMTLTMFADFGHMTSIKGIGVRLGGRICNTMQAFSLSERGIKPGLTIVTEETQSKILELLNNL